MNTRKTSNIRKGSLQGGEVFGRLTVIDYSHTKKMDGGRASRIMNCSCSCGNFIKIKTWELKAGKRISCGCHFKEKPEFELNQTYLHKAFNYDSETGLFTKATGKNIGKGVGSKNNGYIFIKIKGSNYSAHRLAWLYVYGVWPTYHLDHINRLRDDNRINNLRDIPQHLNCLNSERVKNQHEAKERIDNFCNQSRKEMTL